jgi:alpha-D-ribose 1-methylphosphonate 5-triphosphate diphosphatase
MVRLGETERTPGQHMIRTLTNARVVTPTEIIEGASVIIEMGRIAGILRRSERAPAGSMDVRGRYLLPGMVDLHSDTIVPRSSPRPNAKLPGELVFLEMDSYFAWSGITTGFHAISFYQSRFGLEALDRTVAQGSALYDLVTRLRGSGMVHHELHLRCEAPDRNAVEAVLPLLGTGEAGIVSLMDHTVGQGQVSDVNWFKDALQASGRTQAQIAETLEWATKSDAVATLANMRQVAETAHEHGIVLASHDDDTPEKVDLLARLGSSISEFPTTLAAARRAKECGLVVCMGAPNVVRGRSSGSGHLSAHEAAAHGLVDVLVSDYHAPSLLPAVFALAEAQTLTFPAAVRLVSAAPARAAGLPGRGVIEEGAAADLIVVGERLGLPSVTHTLVDGRVIAACEV